MLIAQNNVAAPVPFYYNNIEAYKKDIYKPNANFHLINEKMQHAIENYDTTQGLFLLKEYTRLYKYWNTRVGSDPQNPGSFNDYNEVMAGYTLNGINCDNVFNPNWNNIGSNFIQNGGVTYPYNGMITTVYVNPNNTNEIIAGSSSAGIFRTTNRGINWDCVTDNLNIAGVGINHFEVNPQNPNTIIASTGKTFYNNHYGAGILISHDAGLTWNVVNSLPNNEHFVTIKTIIDPQDTTKLYVLTQHSILYSPNYGLNWIPIFEVNDANNYIQQNNQILNDFVLTNDGTFFIGGLELWNSNTQIWKGNILNGMPWTDISSTFSSISPLLSNYIFEVKFTEIVNDRFYVFVGDTNKNYYYKTENNGNTFTFHSESIPSGGSQKIGFAQSLTRDAIYAGILGPFYLTQGSSLTNLNFVNIGNMGFSYINQNWHADVRYTQSLIDQNTGQELVVYCNDGGIQILDVTNATTYPYYNTNEIITHPLIINQSYDLAVTQFDNNVNDYNDQKKLIIGNQDNGTHSFNFYANQWTHIIGGDGGQCWYASDATSSLKVSNSIISNNIPGVGTVSTGLNWRLNMVAEVDEKHNSLYYTERGKVAANGNPVRDLKIFKKKNGQITTLQIDPTIVKEISELTFAESDESIVYFSGGSPINATTGTQTDNKFFKSINGLQSFINLSSSTVVGPGGTHTLYEVLTWKKICAISVNPSNPDEVWIGISSVAKENETDPKEKYRVLHSTDGGLNWVDYSEGLPLLPVNCIKYVKGTNNLLMVGTDIGIFVRKENETQWHCFKGNLPALIVTGIEIDYCENRLFISTLGRGVWETQYPTSDYFKISKEYPELIISNNQSIEGTYNCVSSIRIKSGATLTVTGTLYMNKDAKIIVERGGKLFVNGGTITNGCNGLWEGIFVEGVKNDYLQSATTHGTAEFDGATIEHAETGVRNFGLLDDNSGNIDWNKTGGIIIAKNSTFINNQRAVAFLYYERNTPYNTIWSDKSYFTNTNFIWDDNKRFPKSNQMFSMYHVHGVKIMLCNFIDNRTNPVSHWILNNSKSNAAVVSADAYYYIFNTNFTNFDFGIWAQNHATEKNIIVKNSTFTNNLYGVELIKVNYPSCLKNNFIINDNNNHFIGVATKQYGIHAIATGKIRFEENNFYDNSTSPIRTVGIVCSDLGPVDAETYKNYFNFMDYGTVTQGLNRGDDKGLQFVCNTNNGNAYRDHLVLTSLWGTPNSAYGVKDIFGTVDNPTRNQFTQINQQQYEDFYNERPFLGYYYDPNYSPEVPQQTYNVFSTVVDNNINQCQSKIKTGGGTKPYVPLTATEKAIAVNDYNTATTNLTQKQTELNNLIDGGNTQALLNQVSNLTPQNKFQLRQTLLSISPYVSEQVIRATIDNHPSKYPHWWAFELVLANIDVARSSDFMDFLANKQYPLPYWMRWTINWYAQNSGVTPRFEKLTEISGLQTQRSLASQLLIQDFRLDTNGTKIDSIIYWTEQQHDDMYLFNKVDLLLEKGQYEQAQTVLNQIDPNNLPDILKQRAIDLITLKTRIRTILVQKGNLAQMSKDDHLFFTQMAETATGSAQYQAQAILCFFFDECKPYVLDLPYGNNLKTTKPIDNDGVMDKIVAYFSCIFSSGQNSCCFFIAYSKTLF